MTEPPITEPQAWSPWFVALWVLWAAVFMFLEGIALRRHDDQLPPLTHVVARWVPGVVTVTGTLWLLWHAIDTYT